MLNFSLFGIPISIQPWFWLTMALIGGGFSANSSLGLILVAVFVVAGFISILVHELGHALLIRKYGLPTSITLVAFGGYATYPPGVLSRKQSFLVSAAGPALQFAMGIALIFLARFLTIPAESLLNALIFDLTAISIIWAIFNCLPIYPMDGGQMLAAILGPKRKNFVYLTSTLCAIGIGVATYYYFNSIIAPIFMALFAWKNWQDFQNSLQTKK
jgi:Zn-dependent protease